MVALVMSKKSKSSKVSKSSGKKEKSTATPKPSEVNTRVDKDLLKKAVDALLKHHQATVKKKNDGKEQLLGAETSVQVQFTLEVAPKDPTRKPRRIEIPHSIFKVAKEQDNDELEKPEVCLIVKDGSKPGVKEMIEQFPEHMGFVKKVLGLESLRKKHAQYSQRRELLKKYSVFMADDRILPMLTACLGKDFFKAKKHPIPVDITRKTSLPLVIHKALSSTFLHLSEGDCVTVRAGYTHMSPEQLVSNITAVMENGVPMIPRKWANIRAIAIKTPTSTSLPFYNKTPTELMEIARLAGISQVWKGDKTPEGKSEASSNEQDEAPKKRKEVKSPLLQALKKQKKAESSTGEEEEEHKEPNKNAQNTETKKPRTTTENSKKKAREAASETTPGPKADDRASAKTKSRESKEEKTEESAGAKAKKRKSKESATIEESPPKKTKASSNTESSSSGKTKTFIVSKKFTGSKDGYVFRKGPKGVGYYADVKPVVDKAALAALARMGRRKKGGRKGRHSY